MAGFRHSLGHDIRGGYADCPPVLSSCKVASSCAGVTGRLCVTVKPISYARASYAVFAYSYTKAGVSSVANDFADG